MGRKVAVLWQASFSIAAGALYFFFVLPRWPELMGDTTHTLGTALRIADGTLVMLAGLPVVFTLLRTRKPEFGTPQLALRLLIGSIVAQVLAGALIVGTASSEIWLSLAAAGQWLFGIYGGAAALALLGFFAFYLSFIAELPPTPPKPLKPLKPLKPKTGKQRRIRRKKLIEQQEAAGEEADATGVEEAGADEARAPESADTAPEGTADIDQPGPETQQSELTARERSLPGEGPGEGDLAKTPATLEPTDTDAAESPQRGLRNQRPAGKAKTARRRGGSPGGVAVED